MFFDAGHNDFPLTEEVANADDLDLVGDLLGPLALLFNSLAFFNEHGNLDNRLILVQTREVLRRSVVEEVYNLVKRVY